MINILIVDDSPTEAQLLKALFESEKDMCVVGHAKNGEEALIMTEKLKPNIITMDIIMPIKDGFETTRAIMSRNPTPIVVISSTANDTVLNTTFLALEAGALSVLEKPAGHGTITFQVSKRRIIDTIRSMSQVKVITRRFNIPKKRKLLIPKVATHPGEYEIIAIGVSVGGPQALKTIFSKLSPHFPIPIVVVQHMTPGFIEGFTNWLNKYCKLTVKCAEHNEELLGGVIYFAPDTHHLQIHKRQEKLIAQLTKKEPVSGFCPSITVLLDSVAKASAQRSIGILLTGMGNDGAEGLLALKNAKGHTLIQDKESAIVFGMAGVAQSLNAVDKIITLDKFADYLTYITKSTVVNFVIYVK